MAFKTAAGIIWNAFLIVLLIHLALVMAVEAGPGTGSRRVAGGTFAVGPAMIGGETVVEIGGLPGAG